MIQMLPSNANAKIATANKLVDISQAAVRPTNASSDQIEGSALTFSHTVSSGSGRLLIVGVSRDNTWCDDLGICTSGITTTGVTFAGQGLTLLSDITTTDLTKNAELWYLINPPIQTGNVVITLSNISLLVGGAVNFVGVNNNDIAFSRPAGAGVDNTVTATINVGSSTQTIVGFFIVPAHGTSATDGAGQVNWWYNVALSNTDTSNSFTTALSTKQIFTGTTGTISWTLSAAGNWVIRTHQINPASRHSQPTIKTPDAQRSAE